MRMRAHKQCEAHAPRGAGILCPTPSSASLLARMDKLSYSCPTLSEQSRARAVRCSAVPGLVISSHELTMVGRKTRALRSLDPLLVIYGLAS